MSETHDSPPLEVHSDEDWKERVKAEDRQRDAQAAQPQTEPRAPLGNLPRADFALLVQMFSTQAMTALGFLPAPGAREPQQHLPLARHFIDLLGVLEEKCRGNLTAAEEKLLTMSLHELRLAYVELSRQAAAGPEGESAAGASARADTPSIQTP